MGGSEIAATLFASAHMAEGEAFHELSDPEPEEPARRGARGATTAIPIATGFVLVAADNAIETYREAAAPRLRVLDRGTKAQVMGRFAVDARDVVAVVLAAAAHLAVPLLGDALAGRLL